MKNRRLRKTKKKKISQNWQSSYDEPVDIWYCKNLDLTNRTVYFGAWQTSEVTSEEDLDAWVVDDFSVQNAIKGLYILNRMSNEPITIIWCSHGGDWSAGMALYDFIQTIKSPVIMKCFGRVRSMGTIILQACKKRLLSPHCEFVIHYGTAGVNEAHAKDVERFAQDLRKTNEKMEQIYFKKIREKNPKFELKTLQNYWLKYDKYLSPKEAIGLGLADGIIKSI